MTDYNWNCGNLKVTQKHLAMHPLGLPKADD